MLERVSYPLGLLAMDSGGAALCQLQCIQLHSERSTGAHVLCCTRMLYSPLVPPADSGRAGLPQGGSRQLSHAEHSGGGCDECRGAA